MIPAVEVEPNLRISFPHRSAEFVAGVRIGVLAAKMATGTPVFDSSVSAENMDQARELAAGMGYRAVVIGEVDGAAGKASNKHCGKMDPHRHLAELTSATISGPRVT